MAKRTSRSVGFFVLQIALGLMLAVSGILALIGKQEDLAYKAIADIFSGNVEKIIGYVFGVIELLVGILLIAELFAGDRFGKFDNILMLIVMIVWIIAIVLADFVSKKTGILGGKVDLLAWVYNFSSHILVLGAMLKLND